MLSLWIFAFLIKLVFLYDKCKMEIIPTLKEISGEFRPFQKKKKEISEEILDNNGELGSNSIWDKDDNLHPDQVFGSQEVPLRDDEDGFNYGGGETNGTQNNLYLQQQQRERDAINIP